MKCVHRIYRTSIFFSFQFWTNKISFSSFIEALANSNNARVSFLFFINPSLLAPTIHGNDMCIRPMWSMIFGTNDAYRTTKWTCCRAMNTRDALSLWLYVKCTGALKGGCRVAKYNLIRPIKSNRNARLRRISTLHWWATKKTPSLKSVMPNGQSCRHPGI